MMVKGNANIIIQNVQDATITVNVNGKVHEIENQLAALVQLMEQQQMQTVQYAHKIYNIKHINEANFGIVTSNKVFNSILSKKLIDSIRDKPDVEKFLREIPDEEKGHWEGIKSHLREAQKHLENNFVWVVGEELRRLFSIGNDKRESLDAKVEGYIEHCFRTYRMTLQLLNFILISGLWDAKIKQPNLKINQKPVISFFTATRVLELKELRQLFQTLLEIFREHVLTLPVEQKELGDFEQYLDSESAFNQACTTLEALERIDQNIDPHDLGHCHTAEMALSTILSNFGFLSSYRLITMRKVEYEEMRNKAPLFIKDLNVLGKTPRGDLQRIRKYDDKPSPAYEVFFYNEDKVINLFPFLLDYNTLTGDKDFQLYAYEGRDGESGLRFYSIRKEKEETLYYRATESSPREIKSGIQEIEEQKSRRIDLVFKQFEAVMNTILDEDWRFTPKDETIEAGNLDNI